MNALPVLPLEQPSAPTAAPPAATLAENPVESATSEPPPAPIPLHVTIVEPEPPTDEVVEKAKEAVVEQAVKPAVEAATEPVIEAVKEPVVEQALEPVVEQTKAPVVEAAVEQVTEQVKEPVIDQAVQQLVRQATQPVVEQAIEELKRQCTVIVPSRQSSIPQPVVDQTNAISRQETLPPPVIEQLARQVTLPPFIAEELARKKTLPQEVVDRVTEVLIRQATSEVQPPAQVGTETPYSIEGRSPTIPVALWGPPDLTIVHEEEPSGEQKADDWKPRNPKKTEKAVRNIAMNIAKPRANFHAPAVDPNLAKAIITPLGMLARHPASVFCPFCNKPTITGINVQMGLCACPGRPPKSVQHSCSECGNPLATWFKFGQTAIHGGARDLLDGKLPAAL